MQHYMRFLLYEALLIYIHESENLPVRLIKEDRFVSIPIKQEQCNLLSAFFREANTQAPKITDDYSYCHALTLDKTE